MAHQSRRATIELAWAGKLHVVPAGSTIIAMVAINKGPKSVMETDSKGGLRTCKRHFVTYRFDQTVGLDPARQQYFFRGLAEPRRLMRQP